MSIAGCKLAVRAGTALREPMKPSARQNMRELMSLYMLRQREDWVGGWKKGLGP